MVASFADLDEVEVYVRALEQRVVFLEASTTMGRCTSASPHIGPNGLSWSGGMYVCGCGARYVKSKVLPGSLEPVI